MARSSCRDLRARDCPSTTDDRKLSNCSAADRWDSSRMAPVLADDALAFLHEADGDGVGDAVGGGARRRRALGSSRSKSVWYSSKSERASTSSSSKAMPTTLVPHHGE